MNKIIIPETLTDTDLEKLVDKLNNSKSSLLPDLSAVLIVILIIAAILFIVALFYIIASYRRKAITLKKVDYLIEDLTFKSERLTDTIDTIAKMANYIDAFETITKKNIKSLIKLINRNKDDLYKVADRLRDLATGKNNLEEEDEN